MDTDYADDIVPRQILPPRPNLLYSMERAAGSIGPQVNTDKTVFMCFNQRGNISTLNNGSPKLVDKFTYLGSSISSTENDMNI